MFATLVNALAIVAGSLAGLFFRKGLSKRYEEIVYAATGIITLVIGMQMAFKTTMVLGFSFALILGGLLGTFIDIQGGVLRFGEFLRRRLLSPKADMPGSPARAKLQSSTGDSGGEAVSGAEGLAPHGGASGFAFGFLNASVLFCSGAMAILGSFQAGTEGNYTILFTKSILDGFIAIMFAGTMGVGVAFSALPILVYQGSLTLLSSLVKPYVTPLMLSELTGVGGALVIMIGLDLLGLKKIRTGDFLPALLLVILAVLARPFLPFL